MTNELYSVAGAAADIAKRFVEEYHQELEETYVFPELAKNTSLMPLISTLKQQHAAAKNATAEIQALLCRPSTVANKRLARLFEQYAAMYDAHSAREDTVIFPAFTRKTERPKYDVLGNTLEEIEVKEFGARGFEKVLAQISGIEKQLDIHDLGRFTIKG